jgi:hypothetical protein
MSPVRRLLSGKELCFPGWKKSFRSVGGGVGKIGVLDKKGGGKIKKSCQA